MITLILSWTANFAWLIVVVYGSYKTVALIRCINKNKRLVEIAHLRFVKSCDNLLGSIEEWRNTRREQEHKALYERFAQIHSEQPMIK